MNIDGLICVVTGATEGIRRALAEALACAAAGSPSAPPDKAVTLATECFRPRLPPRAG